ncbi:MAG: site-specific integrase [Verrucomicrobia bacterium]|nr:site-specific integrase [Verrucomicrobiota bacterium]
MENIKRLVHAMEAAAEGTAILDAEIAWSICPDRKLVLISGEPHWTSLLDGRRQDEPVPHFTRSLDAALPWERITKAEKFEALQPFWRAYQFPLFQADASTEPLARRTAALKMWLHRNQPNPSWSQEKFVAQTGIRATTRFFAEPGYRIPNRDKRDRYRMHVEMPETDTAVIIEALINHIRDLRKATEWQADRQHEITATSPARNAYNRIPYLPPTSMQGVQSIGENVLFSEIFRLWMEDKRPGLKNRQRVETSARRFIEFLGDKPIDTYSKSDLRMFFDALWDLPKFTPHDMKRLPMPVILECLGGKEFRRITVNTVKGHQKDLSTIFYWALHFEYCRTNPAAGFNFVDQRLQSEKRVPFTESDLKLIFEQSPIYAGCVSRFRRKSHGDVIVRDSLFWIGLAGLYTGARLSELARSIVDDYMFEEGVHYLDIHTRRDSPHLKTSSADRQIPIHPELVRLGFLDWVEERRAKGTPVVFEEMAGRRNVDGAKGSWSQCWMGYQRAIGITDYRKVFHSFRHCFKRACRVAGIAEEVHDAITGHRPYMSGRRYGGPMPLQITSEAMSKVRYNLDLKHLYVC